MSDDNTSLACSRDDCRWFDASRESRCILTTGCRFEAQTPAPSESASAVQVGGDHYKAMPIQPFEYIHKNGIGFAEGSVIKYVSRWRNKNGIEDLRKARHFLDLLIEAEEGAAT